MRPLKPPKDESPEHLFKVTSIFTLFYFSYFTCWLWAKKTGTEFQFADFPRNNRSPEIRWHLHCLLVISNILEAEKISVFTELRISACASSLRSSMYVRWELCPRSPCWLLSVLLSAPLITVKARGFLNKYFQAQGFGGPTWHVRKKMEFWNSGNKQIHIFLKEIFFIEDNTPICWTTFVYRNGKVLATQALGSSPCSWFIFLFQKALFQPGVGTHH